MFSRGEGSSGGYGNLCVGMLSCGQMAHAVAIGVEFYLFCSTHWNHWCYNFLSCTNGLYQGHPIRPSAGTLIGYANIFFSGVSVSRDPRLKPTLTMLAMHYVRHVCHVRPLARTPLMVAVHPVRCVPSYRTRGWLF